MPRHSPYALVRLNFLLNISVLRCSLVLLELLEFLNMDIFAAKRFLYLLALFTFPSYDKIV